MGRPNTTGSAFVALVADNPETIDELQTYLGRAGVAAQRARGDTEPGGVPTAATAVVWFADDFAAAAVIAAVGQLRQRRPRLRILLVTNVPGTFAGLFAQVGDAEPPLVLPKPLVGRSILDALRSAVPARAPYDIDGSVHSVCPEQARARFDRSASARFRTG